MSGNPNRPGLARSVLIALLLFLFGNKITTVARLLLHVWDWVRGSDTQDKYVTEASLLALGIGVAAAALLTMVMKNREPDENRTILVGVFVGLAAGLLQILDAVLDPDSTVTDLAGRYFFFFVVYACLLLGPLLTSAMRSSGLDTAMSSLARISCGILLGALGGALVTLVTGALIRLLPVYGAQGDWWSAVDLLIYRPLAFVWLGTVWVIVAFAPADGWLDGWTRPARTAWIAVYTIGAMATAILYVMFFVEPDNGIRQKFALPVELAYALVSASPLVAVLLGRFWHKELRHLSLIGTMPLGYFLAMIAFLAGWGTVSGAAFPQQLTSAALFAIGGAAIPFLARNSVRAGDALLRMRPTGKDTQDIGPQGPPPA